MHAFGNPGPGPARVYELHAPGGLEEFYATMNLTFTDAHLSEQDKHTAFRESATAFGLVHHTDVADEVRARLGL
jgi:hypothetical protein